MGCSARRSTIVWPTAPARELRAGKVRIDPPLGTIALSEHPVFWGGFALFGEPD
jgi:hypothetical protein